jgi:hypothetical protein
MAVVGGVEHGPVALYIDLRQYGQSPACVALGVYTRRRSTNQLITVDQAIALRDAPSAAIALVQPAEL